ncbi:MAG: hypothetical protein IPH88_15700 [Bacteroidales bacterium]|nr:hypothetical protein [Bacteroidales bacterium]
MKRSHARRVRDAINVILHLNPKPGNSMSDSSRVNHYVVPDFYRYQ